MSGNSENSTSSTSPKSPTIHLDSPKSSTSSRSKYARIMFHKLMLGRKDKNQVDALNRLLSMHDISRPIYEQYKKSLKLFVDGISLENLNIVSLALNPRLPPSLIKELIKRIGDDKAKLKEFYHNLAKNENPKVFSILRKEYRDFPDSDKLDWDALSANPNAISIIKKEYESSPESNRIVYRVLSSNTHPDAIRILKKRIEYENDPVVYEKLIKEEKRLKKIINWYALSANPTAIKLLRKEYERDIESNKIKFQYLSNNPQISELKDILVEEANFNKLGMIELASNPFAPRELLEKIMVQKYKMDLHFIFINLAENPNSDAVELLRKEYVDFPNSQKIRWYGLSANTNPKAITLLREWINDEIKKDKSPAMKTPMYKMFMYKRFIIHKHFIHKRFIDFKRLSANPISEAITLLKEIVDIENTLAMEGQFDSVDSVVDWDTLSGNPHPEAIELLREKIEKERTETHFANTPIIGQGRINWEKISANTGAIELIIEKLKKEQPDASGIISDYDKIYRINIDELSKNPVIFVKYEIHATVTATTATTAAKKNTLKLMMSRMATVAYIRGFIKNKKSV